MARKILNIDNIPGLTDELELVLGGRQYTIKNFNQELVDRVAAIAEEDESSSLHEVLARQLCVFVGGSDEDMSNLLKLDVRQLGAAVKRINEAVTEAGERKVPGRKRKG